MDAAPPDLRASEATEAAGAAALTTDAAASAAAPTAEATETTRAAASASEAHAPGAQQPLAARRPAVLFICGDAVGASMAGVGIRYWELAQALAPHADVTLASIDVGELPPSPVKLISYEPHAPQALRAHVMAADFVVAQPQWPVLSAWLRRSRALVVHDLYDPETLETIELYAHRPAPLRRLMVSLSLDRLDEALRTGDRFMCASEKQRDLWLGAMYARRVINASSYDRDPSFRSVIDVVPFGLPANPPLRSATNAIQSKIAAVGDDDEIVLWNGGIWNWLDAAGAVRAFALLSERRPRARLVFMGATTNPAGLRATEEAQRLATELGLIDRVVFFNTSWVPYGERADWLLGASCALSVHEEHLETRFAFRTRLLDCLWAGLPVVCSSGDELAERVQRERLGEAVAPGDYHGLADALERVLETGRDSYSEALARVAREFTWERAAQPLIRWVDGDGNGRGGDGSLGDGAGSSDGRGGFGSRHRPLADELARHARSVSYRLTHRAIRRGFALARRMR